MYAFHEFLHMPAQRPLQSVVPSLTLLRQWPMVAQTVAQRMLAMLAIQEKERILGKSMIERISGIT